MRPRRRDDHERVGALLPVHAGIGQSQAGCHEGAPDGASGRIVMRRHDGMRGAPFREHAAEIGPALVMGGRRMEGLLDGGQVMDLPVAIDPATVG